MAIAFAPGLRGDFLRWDDARLVSENPLVGPPYARHLVRIFTSVQHEAYQPLHTASYLIDHALWGLKPFGCRLFNLVLYAAAACLLLAFVVALGAKPVAATAGVLLFAVHPSHVESVVWISSRKDVLSLVFVAGALLLHVRSKRLLDHPDARAHAGALGLFVLAGLTKTTTLFLPLWLPLVDRWLFGRSWRSAIERAAPMAAVALVLGGLVAWIWRQSGLLRELPATGSPLALTPKVLLHHASVLVLPLNLSALYPIDRAGAFDLRAAAGVLVLVGLVWALRRARSEAPLVALGIAMFLVGLLPVSNLLPMEFQVNDRYLLLPSFGVALGVVGLYDALGTRPAARRWLLIGGGALAVVWASLSFRYAFAWRSDLTLWRHATRAQPRAYYGWMKLGETYRDLGRFDEADRAYGRGIAIEPELIPARGARILNCLAKADRTGADRRAALPLDLAAVYAAAWGRAPAMFGAAQAIFRRGYPDCAYRVILESTEVRPPLSDAMIVPLARDWLTLGHPDQARTLLDRASPAGRARADWQQLDAEIAASH